MGQQEIINLFRKDNSFKDIHKVAEDINQSYSSTVRAMNRLYNEGWMRRIYKYKGHIKYGVYQLKENKIKCQN